MPNYVPHTVLMGSNNDFRLFKGSHITRRLTGYLKWKNIAHKHGFDNFGKSSTEAPLTYCGAVDNRGKAISGVNFSSQDYLALSSHPAIKKMQQLVQFKNMEFIVLVLQQHSEIQNKYFCVKIILLKKIALFFLAEILKRRADMDTSPSYLISQGFKKMKLHDVDPNYEPLCALIK